MRMTQVAAIVWTVVLCGVGTWLLWAYALTVPGTQGGVAMGAGWLIEGRVDG